MEKFSKTVGLMLATFSGVLTVLGFYHIGPQISANPTINLFFSFFLLLVCISYPIFSLFRKVKLLTTAQAKEIVRITGKMMHLLHAGREVFEFVTKIDKTDGLNQIQRIVKLRKAAIISVVQEEIEAAKIKIDELIDNEMIDAFTTKASEHISTRAMREAIDLDAIQKKLQNELAGAQNEINQLILGRLFAEDRYEYFLKLQVSIEDGIERLQEDHDSLLDKFAKKILLIYHPELKQLFQPGYYKSVMMETYGVGNLTDLVRVSVSKDGKLSDNPFQLNGLDLFSVASLFDVGGINEIITGTVMDIVTDEIQNQVLMEMVSWLGDIVLPGLSFVRLAYKSFKLLSHISDQLTTVDCRELKERVLAEVRATLNSVVDTSTSKINDHFNEFADRTLKKIYKMRARQNKILRDLKKYGKKLGKENSYYFPEDDPRFRMYYHYY